jgi:hypothetical protein
MKVPRQADASARRVIFQSFSCLLRLLPFLRGRGRNNLSGEKRLDIVFRILALLPMVASVFHFVVDASIRAWDRDSGKRPQTMTIKDKCKAAASEKTDSGCCVK